jgi:hypothetical protein
MQMEVTACYSLSGYLSLKPLGGNILFFYRKPIFNFFLISTIALSLVLPTRRYWSAFNELTQTLEFYQSERDLINNRTSIESISLYRAAITLSTTEERVFIILYVATFFFYEIYFESLFEELIIKNIIYELKIMKH